MASDRPHVILNAAVTVDGKSDTVARRGAVISSPRDFREVDRLRASSDAVMVGGHTLLGEDPSLTVKSAVLRRARRSRGLPDNPLKVGVVTDTAAPSGGPGLRGRGDFISAGGAGVVLFTTSQTSAEEVARLRSKGARVYVAGRSRVNLKAALRKLRALGVRRLMVEGGGTLNAELLRLGLVDEIRLYIAPMVFGGAGAPTLADGAGLPRGRAAGLKLVSVERFGDGGVVLRYKVLRPAGRLPSRRKNREA